MFLFALLSCPLFGAFLHSAYAVPAGAPGNERSTGFKSPLLRAGIAFLLPAVISVAINYLPEGSFSPSAVFLRALLSDYLLWTLFGTLFALRGARRLRSGGLRAVFLNGIIYWTVLLTLATSLEWILMGHPATAYEAFVRPAGKLVMLVSYPYVLALTETVTRGGWSLFALVAIPVLGAAASLLSAYNRPAWAGTLAFVLALGAWALVHRTIEPAERLEPA